MDSAGRYQSLAQRSRRPLLLPAALAQRKALAPLDPDLGPERFERFSEACRAVLGVDLELDDDHVGTVG